MKRLAKANGVAEKTTMNINGNLAIDINEDILFDYPTGVDKVEKENKNKQKSLIQNYQKSHRHHRSNNRNNTTYTNNNISIYSQKDIKRRPRTTILQTTKIW